MPPADELQNAQQGANVPTPQPSLAGTDDTQLPPEVDPVDAALSSVTEEGGDVPPSSPLSASPSHPPSDPSSVVSGNMGPATVPPRALGNEKVPYSVLKYIPEESAEHYKLVPIAFQDGVLEVGMVDPDNIAGIDALNFISRKTGAPFKVFRISQADFESVINMYRGLGGEVDRALTDLETEGTEASASEKEEEVPITGETALDLDDPSIAAGGTGKDFQEDAPAIKLVSTILRYAIDGKASDVHIEPSEAGVRVRYRVDGSLHTTVVLPKNTHRAIIARVKVLSAIRLDERRKPQDGRFSASIEGRKVDFRVSTFPAYNGEKIVIRILDRQEGFISLDDLGFSPENLAMVREAIRQPHGLILVSGPTGSGKSTTLYSILAELDREQKNILSLEDPVEYYIDGISQSQMRPEIGYTFASGLRTTLRQDPDIIMVGEIRDGETARLAVQAALTGHLVFSTIHTNSAAGTVSRLIDMGVEPYMIPPTLVLTIAQRLVKKLCPETGKPIPITESMQDMINEQFSSLPAEKRPVLEGEMYEAERTPACPNGTRGRVAVMEVMRMTQRVEKVVLENPVESAVFDAARKDGMFTMKEDAIMKAMKRIIPYEEVNSLSGLLMETEEEESVEEVATEETEETEVDGLDAPLDLDTKPEPFS